MKLITFILSKIIALVLINGVWANEAEMFIVPLENEVYVYHNKSLSSGFGFHIYRQDGSGADFIRLTDEPVRGVRRADELRGVLEERYAQVLRFFEEETAGGLFMAFRTKPIESAIATAIYPEAALAMGRLFIDQTAPANREITYRIEFVNNSNRPTGETITRSAFNRPVEIAAPVITNAENHGRRVTLHWEFPRSVGEQPDYVIQFFLFRLDDRTNEPILLTDDIVIRNNAAAEHSISFESPVINNLERYIITAVNFAGLQGPPSAVFEFELIYNIPPRPVAGLSAQVSQEYWVNLGWNVSQDAEVVGYRVYRSTDMSEDFEPLLGEAILQRTEPNYQDTTVTGGIAYFYYVTAVDAVGNESIQGDIVMAQVEDWVIPPTPANLSAVFNPENGEVELSWEMEEFTPNFESFIIMRRREDTPAPGAYARVNMEHLLETQYSDRGEAETGFVEGATYAYVLYSSSRAKNYSDTVSIRIEIPLLTPPEPPRGLTAINDNGHRVNVSWNASPSISTEHYILYRKASGEASFSQVKQLPVSTRFFRDEDLVAGTEYVYTATAIDRAGNESEFTKPDTLFFRNYDPPRSVRNIQAAERETGIELRWERVVADDFAGYRVYRSVTPTGRYEAVHEGLLTATGFLDTDGSPDHWYRVRAVDTSGNESRPGSPVRAVKMND